MTLCLIVLDVRSEADISTTPAHTYAIKRVGTDRYREAELVILVKDIQVKESRLAKKHPVGGVSGYIVKGEAGMAPRDIEMEFIV